MSEDQSSWIVADALQSVFQAPLYHLALEVVLTVWIIFLIFFKSYKINDRVPLSEKEQKDLLADWRPEPLVPPLKETQKNAIQYRKVTGPVGKKITIDGRECLNFASTNFLNLLGNERIQEKVEACVRKYGVGSCGPRGFYGTIDVHLELEKRLAAMMRCEKAIIYSYGFATVASAIPAYAKRGDILFVDEAVNFPIQKGLQASRSELIYFKHNDMNDLENKLKEIEKRDKKTPKKAAVTRKFMVVEGIYENTGQICDLPRLVELKYKYKVRLFVEESFSFGVLGDNGRGVTQHFDIPIAKVDMICANLENSIASIGGFACGSQYVINHQELSGQGYVFSASLPPLVSRASIEALNIIEGKPDVFRELREKAARFRELLSSSTDLVMSGYPDSPMFHVRRTSPLEDVVKEEEELRAIVQQCGENGICIAVAPRLREVELHKDWPPSVRVTVSVAMSDEELVAAADIIKKSFAAVDCDNNAGEKKSL